MPYLRGFGSFLPERRIDNQFLSEQVGNDPAWILNVSGIEERRYADEGATVADLAFAAAQNCLQNCEIAAADIGLILVSSGSGDKVFPGPASEVAARLGLSSTPALDLSIASAGSLVALSLASKLAETYNNVLVIGSEIMSRKISLTKESSDTAILFGDGAGACLVSKSEGFARIIDSAIYTDGNFRETLQLECGGMLQMKGREVIMQATRKIPRAISDLLAKTNTKAAEVDVFLMHQANWNLIVRVAKALEVPEDRFFCNIAKYGNTSSASMLIAADEWWQSSRRTAKGPIIFSAFGAGLNWGALLVVPA